jgi:hypothetical protein
MTITISGGSPGRDRMVVELQLSMQSVPITTKVVSLNPTHGEVYLIQDHVVSSETCLNQTSLRPNVVFGIDRCLVYIDSIDKDFLHCDIF